MISTKQKLYLKKISHSLKPVVLIGQNGLSENVLNEIDSSIEKHELIKVKISQADKQATNQMVEEILNFTYAEFVNKIGHVIVIFKQNKKNPVITLPK